MDINKTLSAELLEELKCNPSKSAPYHNTVHMVKVCDIACWILTREKQHVTDVAVPEEWIGPVLVIAASLHDWGHRAGKTTDDVNVTVAREHAKAFMDKSVIEFPDCVYKAVDSAISCTQFPFVNPPKNHLEKILRDADLLYTTMSGDPAIVLEALRSEMQVALGRSISYNEMCTGQRVFLSNAELFTQAGKRTWAVEAEKFFDAMLDYVTDREV